MTVAAFPRTIEPQQIGGDTVFANLDKVIRKATAEERSSLVVQIAARLAVLGAGWRDPVSVREAAPVTQEPALLTYQDAAKFLSCSVSYVETMVRQGKLPHVKLPAADKAGRFRDGRLVRLLVSDLHAFVAGNKA